MTNYEIIEMARQAGYKHPDAVGQCEDFAYFNLEAFAKLVAAKEREACAKVCEDSVEYAGDTLAKAIRARGEV
jgi:hypothetical protein